MMMRIAPKTGMKKRGVLPLTPWNASWIRDVFLRR
jgi:hypothetical protein